MTGHSDSDRQREAIQHAINVYRTALEDEDQHQEDALRVALLIAYQEAVSEVDRECANRALAAARDFAQVLQDLQSPVCDRIVAAQALARHPEFAERVQ